MTTLQLFANWEPRPGYALTQKECDSHKAANTSQVWRYPTLEFIDAPMPGPGPGQVLVRVLACGVCGSDAHCLEVDGEGYPLFSGATRLPVTIGHEFAGEVIEVGEDVLDLSVGDLVAAESVLWCGRCLQCRSGNVNQCSRIEMVGFSSPGAFAEYIAISERHCWKLDELQMVAKDRFEVAELGALIEPIGCAYNALFIVGGGLVPGQSVAVYGAGPIGLGAIMLARLAGAARVFAFDVSDERCELARKLGADEALNPRTMDQSIGSYLMEATKGEGIDFQVEAAGAASETVPEIQRCFAENGKMVFLGRHDSVAKVDFNPIVTKANHVFGARGHAGHGIFGRIIRLMATGQLPALEMITARFDFADTAAAIQQAIRREDGKIMVRINSFGETR
jgi:scyllo-inosose 3-dehydrogenase